jgi:hypothetical protein
MEYGLPPLRRIKPRRDRKMAKKQVHTMAKVEKVSLSFASPEKENYYFIYYAVIVKQKNYKRSSNYY